MGKKVEMPLVTVLTPVYNRKKEIGNLYKSLLAQTTMEFAWLIVDDGSCDNIKSLVLKWKEEAHFPITYVYQKNGGKHRALNNGVKQIHTPYVFIVDSDDILTTDAIQTVNEDADKLKENKNICGIGYLRGYSEDRVIGDKYPQNRMISDFISVRFKQKVNGDKAEVWKTEDLKRVPFPEVSGEKFMGEGYVWCTLAKQKRMLFVNKIVYITEYLEGGLSQSGRALRIKCPIGGMYSARIMLDKQFDVKNRIKGSLLYVAYGFFAKKSIRFMLKDSGNPVLVVLTLLPGWLLYLLWKKKYS